MGDNKIGKYEIIDILGRGGMGVVYRAIDKGIGRKVAIKTLTEAVAGDAEMLQRFAREAEKTGVLSHPNIVTIYDLGQHNGLPYIVMEYLEGESLDGIIRSARPIPLASKLKILAEVCSALGYAHRNNVIHRDVKPANVIVQPDGTAKLLDFGIASIERREHEVGLTRIGSVIGTAPYMAPERLRGEAFDGRSDIFSAGVMLFQLLTGELPFGADEVAVAQRVFSEKQAPLSNFLESYPADLDGILDRSLAKQPKDRYGTADELSRDLALVAREVKKDEVLKMLPQAEQFVVGHEFTRAREILLEILRVDAQHAGANRLLAEVQWHLKNRQREERIQQLRLRAEEACRDKQFDRALAYLDEAVKISPSDVEIPRLLEGVQQQKQISEQVDAYVRQAEAARRLGDLKNAKATIQKAIEIDKQNSKVIAAYKIIEKQAEEAERKVKARNLIDSARAEMKAQQFAKAIMLLRQASGINTADPALQPLLDEAARGLEQEQQRRAVDEFKHEENAVTSSDQTHHGEEQEALQTLGRAYAALSRGDIEAGRAFMNELLQTVPESVLVQRMTKAFDAWARVKCR